MGRDKETPEIKRERMRQEESKHPSSTLRGSNLADLVGGLNWKVTGILFLVIIIGGIYLLLKTSSPLEIGTIASTPDNRSVVVSVGNKGFRDIQIEEVTVNYEEEPIELKLQHSHALQGFIITDNYKSEDAKEYGFTEIDKVVIKTGTSPASNYENLDNGTATENDEIYGISVMHTEEIFTVHIKYSYFNMTYEDTVYIDIVNN